MRSREQNGKDPGPRTPAPVGAGTKGGAAAAVDDLDEINDPATEDLFKAPANPMGVARKLVERDRRHDERPTLLSWRGGWWEWRRSHWVEVPSADIRAWLYRALERAEYAYTKSDGTQEVKPWLPNRSKIADVLDALSTVCHLGADVEMPSWLGDDQPTDPIVACANGLLELRRNHEGTLIPRLRTLDPAYFNLVGVPFAYDQKAPAPARWLKFLTEVFTDDTESIEALRQVFGYMLSGRTDLQKIILLVGPKRSGKGTIERVLSALIGEANAVGMSLSDLGMTFGLAKLIGKPLAVVSDARLGKRSDATSRLIERLLSISGEGTISISRKMREDWIGKLPTRFMVLTNEVPQLPDASGAMTSRFVVIKTKRSFLGEEDTGLTDKLLGELPGILNWSLQGLRDLTATGAFTEPESSAEARETLDTLGATVETYLTDRCLDQGEVEVQRLYDDYRTWWCERNGEEPLTKAVFCRDVLAAREDIKRKRARDGDARTSVYVGIKLKWPYSTNGHGDAYGNPAPYGNPAAYPAPNLADLSKH